MRPWCLSTTRRILDGSGSYLLLQSRNTYSGSLSFVREGHDKSRGVGPAGFQATSPDQADDVAAVNTTVECGQLLQVATSARTEAWTADPHGMNNTSSETFLGKSASLKLSPELAEERSESSTDTRKSRDTKALQTLQTLLSPQNLSSAIPRFPSPSTLKSLYYIVKSSSQLPHITSWQSSALISIFGMLSLPTSGRAGSRAFAHPLVDHIPDDLDVRNYWKFMLQIFWDKAASGRQMDHCDHYWAMRAELDKVPINDVDLSADALTALSRARKHYFHVAKRSREPQVHLVYLEVLLSLGTADLVAEAAARICGILRLHPSCHPSLIQLLWDLVLSHSAQLTPALRERLLAALWGRVDPTAAPISAKLPKSYGKLVGAFPQDHHSSSPLVLALQQVLFSGREQHVLSSPTSLDATLLDWAGLRARAIFDPASNLLHRRWKLLSVLALAASPPGTKGNGDALHDGPSTQGEGGAQPDFGAMEVQLVCILQTLESLSGSIRGRARDREGLAGIRQMGVPLWRMFEQCRSNMPEAVVKETLATFFRLVAMTQDATLLRVCKDFHSQWPWSVAVGDRRDGSGADALDVHATVAIFACYQDRTEDYAADLWSDSNTTKARTAMVAAAILRLISIDVPAAHRLYKLSERDHIRVPGHCTVSLCKAFVSRGDLESACLFLGDYNVSVIELQRLLVDVVQPLAKNWVSRLTPTMTRPLLHAMIRLSRASAPLYRDPELRPSVHHALLSLASSGQIAKAASISRDILIRNPGFLKTRFISRILSNAVRQRQFRQSARLLNVAASNPEYLPAIGSWRRILVLGAAGGRAARQAISLDMTRRGARRDRSSFLATARIVGYRLASPTTVGTLKVVRLLKTLEGSAAVPAHQRAAHLLVNGGRILAAKRLFHSTQGRLPDRARTSVGNTILHAMLLRPRLRNGRLMRKLLDTLKLFVRDHGFVPDRVTVNIIVKALSRWTSAVDGTKLRGLFDHFIRQGYPTGRRSNPGNPPFGTPLEVQTTELPFMKEMKGQPSFERHVRPMYKTFIKAFHLREDHSAAGVVVGILQAVQNDQAGQRERRERARMDGRVRVKKRRAIQDGSNQDY